MNKRIKKKHKQKEMKKFIKAIKELSARIIASPVPATPSFEQECRMIEDAYREAFENAGYAVSDIILSKSDHPGIIDGKVTLTPKYFPIDIKILKERKLTHSEDV